MLLTMFMQRMGLEAIAHSDDDLADDEKALLDGLKETWSL